MGEPRWLDRLTIDAIHYDQLQQHSGRARIKDENAIESALARPRHKLVYEPEIDIFGLAAAYGYGLGTNHGYIDGNKRVAFMAMYTFLGVNGWEIAAAEPEVVEVMLAVAAGEMDEDALAAWLRDHVMPFA